MKNKEKFKINAINRLKKYVQEKLIKMIKNTHILKTERLSSRDNITTLLKPIAFARNTQMIFYLMNKKKRKKNKIFASCSPRSLRSIFYSFVHQETDFESSLV